MKRAGKWLLGAVCLYAIAFACAHKLKKATDPNRPVTASEVSE